MRICTRCLLSFNESNFYKKSSRKDGLDYLCKPCRNETNKEYWNNNLEKMGIKRKEYLKNTKSKIRNAYLKREYGISLDEFQELLVKQEGKCWICKIELLDGRGMFSACIDHDHMTGKIRGLLCTRCNLGLGYFEDDIERMKDAINYLEEFLG